MYVCDALSHLRRTDMTQADVTVTSHDQQPRKGDDTHWFWLIAMGALRVLFCRHQRPDNHDLRMLLIKRYASRVAVSWLPNSPLACTRNRSVPECAITSSMRYVSYKWHGISATLNVWTTKGVRLQIRLVYRLLPVKQRRLWKCTSETT